MTDIDTALKLSNFIREIDGNHRMGACELAERITEWFALHQQEQAQGKALNLESLARLAESSEINAEVTYDDGIGSPLRHDVDISEDVAAWIRRQSPAPAAVPEGWKLVPVEPTHEMREAYHDAHDDWDDGIVDTASPDHEWAAMLTAVPNHQATGEDL